MKIAIIGAGFTGLSAAYSLLEKNHSITIFEKESLPGGLALGFKEKGWDWPLENHYHHWFTNDSHILSLAKNIGYEVFIKRPKTSVYIDHSFFQLDSPLHILKFPKLSPFERIRMGITLASLRYNPFWKLLEGIKITEFLPRFMGKSAYSLIWEPQLHNKFGDFLDNISLAWFWARIKKRTSSLAYPKGGFLEFAKALTSYLEERNIKTLFQTEIQNIEETNGIVSLRYKNIHHTKIQTEDFDAVIVTLPSIFFLKIAPRLPEIYKKNLLNLQGLGAINLVLRLKKQFLPDDIYWLSICDRTSPIMAIVEHTNFMDKKHYNNEHLVYLGNYIPRNHPYFSFDSSTLLKKYDPFLTRINPAYKSTLIATRLFSSPFAQPIIPINYSKIIPPLKTPLKNVYLANIQQVYPWDRGTNYAVELGEKVAKLIG